ncbi:MAG: FAD/NAD(P)-binding oxidoreductase [Pseudomonadota bacterium]
MATNDGSKASTRPRRALSRRAALALGLGATAAGLCAPARLQAQSSARVVVVGGGVAGAAIAARLAPQAGLDVTLVSVDQSYATGSFSNLYLAGFRSLASLTFRYDAIAAQAGYRFVQGRAVAVERAAKEVVLGSGARLGYDRLVLAPGAAFRDGELVGYDVFARERMPHGCFGGYQAFLLKRRIAELPAGGLFALTVPKAPYTGPLSPYERAGMIALALGRENPRAKVLIVDANDDFPMREAFQAAWRERYGDRVEWWSGAGTGGGLARVDAPNQTLVLGDGETLRVDGASVVPDQRAGAIALQAELADEGGWVPVGAETLRTAADPAIFAIGDAVRLGDAPKSAEMARAHAVRAAEAIQADLLDAPSTLGEQAAMEWAFVGHDDALRSEALYVPDQETLRRVSAEVTEPGASSEELRQNALDANIWHALLTEELFG